MLDVGNCVVEEEKLIEWRTMLNVDEIVAENLAVSLLPFSSFNLYLFSFTHSLRKKTE
jgi:hypothetical protein